MNDVVEGLINYKYNNEQINKWIRIYKRTKKKRIKNKLFAEIICSAIKERKVIKFKDVVLMEAGLYFELQMEISEAKKTLEQLE